MAEDYLHGSVPGDVTPRVLLLVHTPAGTYAERWSTECMHEV